jgi:membrane associated rhomboid family serine protease
VDLNHIFLFVAVVSPLLVLARAWRPGGKFRGWRIAAMIVLAITGVSWLLFRNIAGYIGGGVWFALLFIPAIGLRRVSDLFAQRRYRAARRLAAAVQVLHPTLEVRQQIDLIRRFEPQQHAGPEPRLQSLDEVSQQHRHRQLKNAPAVLFFIAANIIVFLIEVARHSGSDPAVLHRLGALDFYSVVIDHQYWRLLTALFLHYGTMHLLFNLFALYVLGPPLERIIGHVRLSVCYLISGLGSTAGVIFLTAAHLIRPSEVVGASGCIMGIVGAWAGFLLRHRRAPGAWQRLMNILLIVAIQAVFDLSTPQISMAAHVCGLVTGFVVGLLMAPKISTNLFAPGSSLSRRGELARTETEGAGRAT